MTRRILSLAGRIALVAAVLAAAWYGWRWWNQSRELPLEERFQIEEVGRGDVTQTVTASGTLNPVVMVSVGTQVSGTVQKLLADFNDSVEKGQVLLELDPTLFNAAVEQSRGNVASAEAALRLAQANERRARELFDKEYIPRQELDQAVQVREAAEAQLRSSRGQLARDNANVGYSVIRSPVSGVVVSRQVDIGQTVAASFQTPTLFEIAQDLTRMQINTNVAEADIGKVRVDQPVSFTVDAFPGRRFTGSIRQVRLNPIIEQNVVTYNVVVAVDNPDLALLPGMTAYISIDVDHRSGALLVPSAALRFRPRDTGSGPMRQAEDRNARKASGPRVYVVRGEELVPVAVQTGITDGRMVEVTAGELQAGDRLVIQRRITDQAGSASGSGRAPRVRAF
jgi:HlyD family secretion protein